MRNLPQIALKHKLQVSARLLKKKRCRNSQMGLLSTKRKFFGRRKIASRYVTSVQYLGAFPIIIF